MNSQKKLITKRFILAAFFAFAFIGIFLVQSCDTADNGVSPTSFTADKTEVYALSSSSLVIDLAEVAGVTASDEVSISNAPEHGVLSKLSGTLYKYRATSSAGADNFSIHIAGRGANENNAIKIVVSRDTTSLPCKKLHAVEDYSSTAVNTIVSIPFLANDRLCDVKKKNLQTAIFEKPAHGKATIKGNKIIYKPNFGFQGSDSLIYRISAPGKGKSYGLVSIFVGSSTDSCTVIANDDDFSVEIGGTYLYVLANDLLCGNDSITILSQPHYGNAFPNVDGSGQLAILYLSDSIWNLPVDTLRYRVCSPASNTCSDATVIIH